MIRSDARDGPSREESAATAPAERPPTKRLRRARMNAVTATYICEFYTNDRTQWGHYLRGARVADTVREWFMNKLCALHSERAQARLPPETQSYLRQMHAVLNGGRDVVVEGDARDWPGREESTPSR